MARSLHVRLDDAAAAAFEIVRAGELGDSEAVRGPARGGGASAAPIRSTRRGAHARRGRSRPRGDADRPRTARRAGAAFDELTWSAERSSDSRCRGTPGGRTTRLSLRGRRTGRRAPRPEHPARVSDFDGGPCSELPTDDHARRRENARARRADDGRRSAETRSIGRTARCARAARRRRSAHARPRAVAGRAVRGTPLGDENPAKAEIRRWTQLGVVQTTPWFGQRRYRSR